jgi:hypothetical protein
MRSRTRTRTVYNSLAATLTNWTLDNVAGLIDDYARGMREALDDCETEFRDFTVAEIQQKLRAAQLDLNMLRRLVKLGQYYVDQIANGELSIEKARELSGEIPADERCSCQKFER